jgi:predicted naringenin-chalcone synthase
MAKDQASEGNPGRHGRFSLVDSCLSDTVGARCRQAGPHAEDHEIASIETYRQHTVRGGLHRPARPVPSIPAISGLAVLEPQSEMTQRQVLERLGLAGDEFAERIFARSGVERRDLNLDEDFLQGTLEQRAARVERELLDRAVQSVERLDLDPGAIGTVLTSSLYSLGCPSLAQRLIEHFGLDPAVDKYHVTAAGCSSAVPLFRLGTQMLHSEPSREVLVVAAESMSSLTAHAREDNPRVRTVGAAIFGDGCAAALLSARRGAPGPSILATAVHQVPGTLGAVEVTGDEQGAYLQLAPELPKIAGEQLAGLVEGFLSDNGISEAQIAHWMLHPGGRRIVEEARDALGLEDEDVAISWRALADHGNVGTPSIFYVLDATVRERTPKAGELGLCVTIGPGVAVGLMLIGF